jgi:hypothetical protein
MNSAIGEQCFDREQAHVLRVAVVSEQHESTNLGARRFCSTDGSVVVVQGRVYRIEQWRSEHGRPSSIKRSRLLVVDDDIQPNCRTRTESNSHRTLLPCIRDIHAQKLPIPAVRNQVFYCIPNKFKVASMPQM